ncbi:MAG TPA: rhodanese-like domain-containing protein [Thermoanaerobaculia bacterium]|jgi:rhodanese-related sulfurtransferase|nr:rhodanese-like domain-containing protein [Thermoanaerobaculia bacterium]
MILLLLAILTKADVPRVTVEELRPLLANGDAIAIDVRGSVPYELGHLPGAVWMPLGVLQSRAGELPEEKLLVMYCTCKAEESSLDAAMLLSKAGFARVAVLYGGYPAWVGAGFPVDSRRDDELAAPAAVSCAQKLRKVSGPVTRYRREQGKTVLTIGEETITLRHDGGDDPSRFFLVNGTPFANNDWNRVEVRKGEAREGVKATAWLCPDAATIIDWQP